MRLLTQRLCQSALHLTRSVSYLLFLVLICSNQISQAQSATVTLNDSNLLAGETATVTIVFTEAVSMFDNTDFSAIPNGVLGAVSSGDNITWTATFTPNAATNDATNTIDLDLSAVFFNVSMTFGVGTVSSANYTVNTVLPTATVTVADTSLLVGETSLVTFLFSEAVGGFTNADLTIPNGMLTAVSSGDGGITWTATFTPTASVTDASNVIDIDMTGVASIASTNAGSGTTSSNNFAIDTLRPTVTITVADTTLLAGETSLVTFTFSEVVAGFANGDLTIDNGSLTAVATGDNITFTATFTPSINTTDPTNLITIDNTAYTDTPGNTGSATTDSNNYAVSTLRPTVTVVSADTSLILGETSVITFTFSEVVAGFSNADLTIANGTLSAVQTSDNITWTATLTPNATVTDPTNVIAVTMTGVSDIDGNTGLGVTNSNNYAIDNVQPTVTIVVSDTAIISGDTSLVTITFSEAVTGFANADLTIANGTLSTLQTSNNITWTATFTPSAAIEDPTNIISINHAGYTDVPGNTGSGATDSNNYQIDTIIPTVSIATQLTSPTAVNPMTFTITFSETVTGLATSDFVVGNGTVAALTGSGVNYSVDISPTANGVVSITVPAGSANDALGNGNSVSATFTITFDDTSPATLSIASGVRYKPINTLTGTGIPNSLIDILDNGVIIGTVTSDAAGDWSLTVIPPLIFGDHSIVASGINGLSSLPATISIYQSPLDADGDGTSDIALFKNGTCAFAFTDTSEVTRFVSKLGGRKSLAISADYDGDGLSECATLTKSGSNLKWHFYDSVTQSTTTERFGKSTDYVVTGCSFDSGLEKDMVIIRGSSVQIRHKGDRTITKFNLPLNLDGSRVRGCGDMDKDGIDELLFKITSTQGGSTQYNLVSVSADGRLGQSLYNVGDFNRAYIIDATGDLEQDVVLSFPAKSKQSLRVWEVGATSQTSRVSGISKDFAIGNCIDSDGIYNSCVQYRNRSNKIVQYFFESEQSISTTISAAPYAITDPYQNPELR